MFGRISTCARGGRGDVHFTLFFARDSEPRRRADLVEAVRSEPKSCPASPVGYECQKTISFEGIQHARGSRFSAFLDEKVLCFHMFS